MVSIAFSLAETPKNYNTPKLIQTHYPCDFCNSAGKSRPLRAMSMSLMAVRQKEAWHSKNELCGKKYG